MTPIQFPDAIEFEGAQYLRCTLDEPSLLITMDRRDGSVTVLTWGPLYANGWWADPEHGTHRCIGGAQVIKPTGGVALIPVPEFRDLIQHHLDHPDILNNFEYSLEFDPSDLIHWEASVEYEMTIYADALDRLLAALPERTCLAFVDYNDRLHDRQLDWLRAGKLEALDEDIFEAFFDQRLDYIAEYRSEALAAAGLRADDLDEALLDELEQAIVERDDAAPLDDVLRYSDAIIGVRFVHTEDEQGCTEAAAFRIDASTLWDFWWQHERSDDTYLVVTGEVWAGTMVAYPDLQYSESRTFLVSADDLRAGWLDGKDGRSMGNWTWDECALPVWGRATGQVVALTEDRARLVRMLLADGVSSADAVAAAEAVTAA